MRTPSCHSLTQGTATYLFPETFNFDSVNQPPSRVQRPKRILHTRSSCLPHPTSQSKRACLVRVITPSALPAHSSAALATSIPTDNACTSCGFFSVKKPKPNPPAGGNGAGVGLNPFGLPNSGFDNVPTGYGSTGSLFNFPGGVNTVLAGGASYLNGPGPVGGDRVPGTHAFGANAARISKDDLQQRQAKAALIELAKDQGNIHTLRTNGVYSAVDWAQAQAIHGENASRRLASITDKDGTYNLNKIDAATLRAIYMGNDSKPFDVKGAAGASTAPLQGAGKALDGTIVALAGKLRLLALPHLPAIRKYILFEQYFTIKPISILIPQLHTVAAKDSIFAAAKVSSNTTTKAPVTFTFAPCVTPAQLRVTLRNLRHFRLAVDDAERVNLQFDQVEKLVDYAEENNWRVSEVFNLVASLYDDHTIAINHWVGTCAKGPRPMLGNFGPAASAIHRKASAAAIIRDPDDVDPLWYGSVSTAPAPSECGRHWRWLQHRWHASPAGPSPSTLARQALPSQPPPQQHLGNEGVRGLQGQGHRHLPQRRPVHFGLLQDCVPPSLPALCTLVRNAVRARVGDSGVLLDCRRLP